MFSLVFLILPVWLAASRMVWRHPIINIIFAAGAFRAVGFSALDLLESWQCAISYRPGLGHHFIFSCLCALRRVLTMMCPQTAPLTSRCTLTLMA